jgi:hypothetical protein
MRQAPQEEQVKVLMKVCDTATSEVVRVKCIGVLECLAQHPQSVAANRVSRGSCDVEWTKWFARQIISEYLLGCLPSAESSGATTEVALQAASGLIDIYSDETLPYDANFRQGGFLEKLAGSIDGIKRAVRGIDRKKEGGRELRVRGEEVRDNLVAFVQYRRDLGL